ncbi:hypothetical protein FOIG_02450 [Fusarium odoratissimum NRRL 54006]|uniref:Amidase domain-containing protein n=2 Tax=Fusarium oxysporum species complex TaxID=171631 RepID=X0K1M6_FUSO5|nr:uncharacterized protein FOIG_02450 [Fusarium odoratissimum NRRL 54006]EXM07439.1 hypothetical protein FOIG_02450 [Fusarium odoratissimum NRRL 54006]
MTSSKYTTKVHEPWTEIVTKKRAIRDAQIDKHSKADTNSTFDRISSETVDVEVLTSLLRDGKVSAVKVIHAYIRREVEITVTKFFMLTVSLEPAKRRNRYSLPTNCLTEICFDDALEQARKLDGFQEEHGQLIGPLHGVPVTVKDQFNITGLDSTLGYIGKAFAPAENDALLIQTLKKLGAVIIAKTNLPQSIMSGRLSYRGVEVTLEGQQHIPSAVGPMARTLNSLKLVTKLAIEAEPWTMDPQLPPLPWRENLFQNFVTRRLVIGSMLDDGMIKVHPPVERVFRNLVAKLEAAGHEVIEWDSSLNSSIIDIMDGYYAADGGEDIRRAVAAGGEPFIPQIEAFVNRGKPISAFEYWQLNKRKVATQQAYHDMWDSKRSTSGRSVDVLLVPTMPHTAVPHGSCRWTGYTKIFNFLDYTALAFPAGNASKDGDDRYFWDHIPRNETDAWNQQLYDPVAMDGRCVGLQIIGRRFEEEKVLGAAQQIHTLL